MPFDFRAQVRELRFPAHSGFPNGYPSLVYYFVPNTGWGSERQFPSGPTDPEFVYCTDGIGLNLGCPVRLLRALDVLNRLAPEEQFEIRNGLKAATKHLATVEELLWLTAFRSPSCMKRGGTIAKNGSDVDWFLKSSTFPFYIESKFRPSDWPRLSDQGTFLPMAGSFLGKVANKFPDPPHEAAIYCVGITVYQNLTDAILSQIGHELAACPQVHVVIFRTIVQMTHVISLDSGLRDPILSFLAIPSLRDYPINYAVFLHREQRDKRISLADENPPQSVQAPHGVSCWPLEPRSDGPIVFAGDAYRLNIASRGADGEPQFQAIPKYL